MKNLTATTIRLGHSFPHPKDVQAVDPVGDLLDLMHSQIPIGPRAPQESSVVWLAESLLKIDRTKRPVYTYVGCLHPALGTIGLIIHQDWLTRSPQGVSRCDSGGLVGRLGAFSVLSNEEAQKAVIDLSLPIDDSWTGQLDSEINSAHSGDWKRYLHGNPPLPSLLNDARGHCLKLVQEKGEAPDRRLWTWEARSFACIEPTDVEAIALSPEATKDFYSRMRMSNNPLPRALIIVGKADSDGVHYFHEDAVLNAFKGEG